MNLAIIKETLEICERGFYYVDGKKIKLVLNKEQIENAVVYTDKQISKLIDNFDLNNKNTDKKTIYSVCNTTSFEAACKINSSNNKTLVLNFANPINPGGGVRIGARAQEEDLCRKSTLLLSLEGKKAKNYYNFHRNQRSLLSSDYMIITPNVEVFRNGDNSLSANPFIVSVLTCAAPIMTESVHNMPKIQYENIFYHRIKGVLCLAISEGFKNIVLGAWGCGAFGNDANVVAALFYKAFKELENSLDFDNVVMAVLDNSISQYNYKSFKKYFG